MARTGRADGGGAVRTRHAVPAAVQQQGGGATLLPGRHACSCQARLHPLVLNCMGCGKVVCAQEGSGPCFFCGTLVCTREEKEIIDRNSNKSKELYKKLTGKEMPEGGALSLASIAAGMQEAIAFRDTLLLADADSERRTRVNDAESDAVSAESNAFLSQEERNAIIRRREELREIREKRKRALVVDIDYASLTTTDRRPDTRDTDVMYDPVIRQILNRSDERRRAADIEAAEAAAQKGAPRTHLFVPKYLGDDSCNAQRALLAADYDRMLGRQSDEAAAMDVERRGYALALKQPEATLIANGVLKEMRWEEDPALVGPIFITSLSSKRATKEEIEETLKKRKLRAALADLDYSGGSVLGRCFLAETLTLSEWKEENREDVSTLPGNGKYVLRFSYSEPLLSGVPHIPPAEGVIYQLDASLKAAMSHVFSG